MLPKGWGKAHGRTRFETEGRALDPMEEIPSADRGDEALVHVVVEDDILSQPGKRRRRFAELARRLTDGYAAVQRDVLQRIAMAALGASRVGREVDDEGRAVPSHK